MYLLSFETTSIGGPNSEPSHWETYPLDHPAPPKHLSLKAGGAGVSLEDGDEQVEQQDVGEQQVHTEHEDGEPGREGGHLVVVQQRALGL